MMTKCTDGEGHDYSDWVEDKDETGEGVGTSFVRSKCGKPVAEVAEEGLWERAIR